MRNPNCNLCGLCNGVNTICLWGEGYPPCDVMVIGRDPGEEEDKIGRPFVGRSGKLLEELLQAAGLKREDVFISNICKCRPPGNRPHTSEERTACRVYLDQEIAAVQPKVIIVLGGDALEAITGQTQVMKLAGQTINFKNDKIDCQVFVSVHPSYILRNDSYKERAIKHFEDFGRLLRGEDSIKSSPVKYVYVQTIEQVRKLIVKMHQQKFIVFDTETTGFDFLHDKILCFSFSWKENTAVVLPLLGYKQAAIWPEQDYNEIITSLQNLFANPNIEWCAQNISFDAKFMKTYNMEIVGPIHDTMILQTLCDENAVDLKGLKDMAKLYTDMGDYSEPLEKFKTGLKIEKRKVIQTERKEIKGRIKDLKKMLKKVEQEVVQSTHTARQAIDITYDIIVLEHKLEELKNVDKDISYAEIPTNTLWPYAAMDADATMRIFNVLMSKLYEESAKHAFSHNGKPPVNMVRYYKKLVMKLRRVLNDMEYHGAKLNLVYLAELDEKYTKRLSELEVELLEMGGVKQTEVVLLKESQKKAGKRYDTLKSVMDYKAGTGKKPKLTKKEYCIKHEKTIEFNMNSHVHLRILLFDVLKLVHPFPNKKGKTGLSTDVEVLEALEDKHPCVTKLQENRKLSKLHKTYVKGQMKLADANARVHTDFNQHITVTGRLSSSHPNLQNIPRANKEIKRAFVVEPGYFILQLDLAQAEFRFWAELSNDRDMISDIASGMDIHRATASQFWGIPEKDVTSEQRSAAKFVVFGLMYGRGAESVAKQVKISTEEAQAIIDQFFAKYPVASRWLRSTKTFTEKRGFVSGYFGRVRRLPYARLRHMDRQKWGESMRQAVNAPIQGGAADLTGIAMIKIHSELKVHPELKAHLILTVHDSIILEVYKKDLVTVMKMCHQKMIENVDDMTTSMAADIEVGLNWGDLQSISINNIDREVAEYLKTLGGVEV